MSKFVRRENLIGGVSSYIENERGVFGMINVYYEDGVGVPKGEAEALLNKLERAEMMYDLLLEALESDKLSPDMEMRIFRALND